jgi:hypothetical protein
MFLFVLLCLGPFFEEDVLLVAEELPLHPNALICRALSNDFTCHMTFVTFVTFDRKKDDYDLISMFRTL